MLLRVYHHEPLVHGLVPMLQGHSSNMNNGSRIQRNSYIPASNDIVKPFADLYAPTKGAWKLVATKRSQVSSINSNRSIGTSPTLAQPAWSHFQIIGRLNTIMLRVSLIFSNELDLPLLYETHRNTRRMKSVVASIALPHLIMWSVALVASYLINNAVDTFNTYLLRDDVHHWQLLCSCGRCNVKACALLGNKSRGNRCGATAPLWLANRYPTHFHPTVHQHTCTPTS